MARSATARFPLSFLVQSFLHFVKRNRRPGNSVQSPVPDLNGAQLAAVYDDQRVGGDCYDFLRVSPARVLFILLDVAGRIDDNREIVSSAQGVFRSVGAELFAREDVN